MEDRSPPIPELLSHAGFVRRLAGSLVRDAGEADDLAQDALVAAMVSPERPRHLGAWLGGTVRNLARMSGRSAGRRRRREEAAAPRHVVSLDPADIAAQVDVQRRVVEAVVALGEPYRSTIVHRYYHDLGPEEIARLANVPLETVRTRLRRAHRALRERLDARFGTRHAWTGPLLPLLGAPVGAAGPAVVGGGIAIMKAQHALALVLLPLLGAAIAVPVWTAVRSSSDSDGASGPAVLRTENERLVAENRSLRERLTALGSASPSLQGGSAAGAAGAEPSRTGAEEPAPAAGAAPGSEPSRDQVASVEWKRWIPVLDRYRALADDVFPDDALRSDLEALLSALGDQVPGRSWKSAEDLLRAPEIGSGLAVALAEHLGAEWTPAQREELLADLRKILAELDRESRDLLPEERMAKMLEAIRKIGERVGASARPAVVSQLSKFLFDLLQERGWGTIHLGVVVRDAFLATVLQIWSFHADFEPAERSDVGGIAERWWRDAVSTTHDLVRRHGRAKVLAAVLPPDEDTPETAAARRDEAFDAVRIATWAAFAALQARAAREHRTLWDRLPAERRRSMDALQPSLFLYFPEVR